MAPGDLKPVDDHPDLYYLDTGMYDVEGYGSVYIFDTDQPALVDTGIGTNREYIFAALDQLDIDSLAYILPTHAHLDHAGGAGFLAERYPEAEVLIHERAVRHLVDPDRLISGTKSAVGEMWTYYTEPKPVPEDRIRGLTDGETVDLGSLTLTAHEAPGHAPHQHVFETDTGVVFTADAAGLYVPDHDEIRVTSPPSQFDVHQCLDDVSMIQSLDPELLCFGHFGPRAYNEQLLDGYKRSLVEWVEAIRQRRESLSDDDAVIRHFVDHTELTEIWGTEKGREETKLNVRGVLSFLDRQD
ncbi:glyoxylase-like metal-dependent hydrolase (beta-lactamase superfamily II) [Halohasta litchfieldiae]|uniref:Glyoxylase, beta-lactamase superfamily II n=1 Tax=Halohasta litchfieldiae TaxID=1073996 RepID=A0A1H6XJ48_9EURY|nr:MBL fold metallo-hydrolase [Halohasta litchfieldiae]ATW90034.1 glyoxylase-like metal-dependent hydrolase (beta-lactamase superfamily II) [Halohasta litchfieldiae]SEJ24870.1 Glyoxylase, beta-lactamase superfamily II [Halohasta litchfieldiae]